MAGLIQPSFAKGEIAPTLYGRVDTAAYHIALAKALNCNIHTYGGVSNRPGTIYIGPCKEHTYAPRLIPFQFKTADQYVLEFGNLYMRVIRDDAYVTETALTGCTATAANPVVVTKSSHGYSNGDIVFISGNTEMVETNTNFYIVADKTTNTFELTHFADGSDIDGSGFTAETTGGSCAKIFTLTTTYVTADLDQLKYTQSADTMTITHKNYPARDITRTGHASWTIADVAFIPRQDHPTGMSITVNTSGSLTTEYAVTAIRNVSGEESLSALNNTSKAISGATVANPVVITATSHGFLNGDEVEINSVVGMVQINSRRFIVSNKATNTFELLGIDGTDYTAWGSGGTAHQTFVRITNSAATEDNTVAWTGEANAAKYAIYRKVDGVFGLCGEATGLSFEDDNITPDTNLGPPIFSDPISLPDTSPGTTSYFEQRQVFGGSVDNPDTAYYSRVADRTNLAAAVPAKSDDAFSATFAQRQLNEIRHFVSLNDLLVFTSGSEWRVNSGPDTAFELASIRQKPQSFWGCNHVQPVVIGNIAFFIEESGSIVRSLGYSFQLDGYTGTNIGLLANHLLKNNTIVDWTAGLVPEVRFYMCRNDGVALTFTFDNEQEVIAWTTWETDGSFERCSSLRHLSNESQDNIYFVVKRTIDGNTVRYVEKVALELVTEDPADANYVDSGLKLDSPLTITASTAAKPVVITAASHGFSDGDLVDIEGIKWTATVDSLFTSTQPIQVVGQYKIAEKTTNTFELATTSGKAITAFTRANPGVCTAVDHGYSTGDEVHFHGLGGMTEVNGNGYTITRVDANNFSIGVNSSGFTAYTVGGRVHLAIDGSAYVAYVSGGKARKAVTSVRGLDHLEGETLVGNLDGNVVRDMTVSGGAITFPGGQAHSRAYIGMPYIAEVETLDLEVPRNTIQGLKKKIPKVSIKFENSRGMVVGPAEGRTTSTPSNLTEMKQREFERLGEPTRLFTGIQVITLKSAWKTSGKLLLRQKDPMPMNITSIIPELQVGDPDDV
jgi:hypothetical protein